MQNTIHQSIQIHDSIFKLIFSVYYLIKRQIYHPPLILFSVKSNISLWGSEVLLLS